jgi:hypothetical protein
MAGDVVRAAHVTGTAESGAVDGRAVASDVAVHALSNVRAIKVWRDLTSL